MGASEHTIFNFSPSAQPLDMAIYIQSFIINHFPSLMIAMSKLPNSPSKSIHPLSLSSSCTSGKQCHVTVDNLLMHSNSRTSNPISTMSMTETLKHGIIYYHEALDKQDKRIIHQLLESGAIQVLVVSMVAPLFCVPNSQY
ncbi:hypothetical protein BDN70DRAFT_909394 [Pholiota conissans]|uniref:Uncharacterized protein n=1 Tax=Pholiota conissans TaxID=109636 RepID=A0A9P5YL45_9AGAR|nr:hypothetical protein BDN70DRAFT_909394 [Pholiota conissans]